MILTKLPGNYSSILFNMTELEEELRQVDCSICPGEYLAWLLVDLGFPVLTPPWMEAPKLIGKAHLLQQHHMREINSFLVPLLKSVGYNGQELLVTTRPRAYCAVSFSKEQ